LGLIYSSADSSQLLSALAKNLASGKEAMDQLKSGSQKIVEAVDGQTLSGKAYTAGKGLFSDLVIPTITRVTTAVSAVEQDMQTYTTADSSISSEGYSDEDNLNRQIEIKRTMKTSIDLSASFVRSQTKTNIAANLLDSLFNFEKNLNRMSGSLQQDIDELQKKIQKLHDFSSSTNGLFSTSLGDMKLAMQCILVLNNTTINNNGTYSLPAGTDKSWFTSLKNTAKLKKAQEKREYIQLLQDQFGFAEATAKQIYKVKEGIDKEFSDLSQKERDYLFARILGEFSYGEGFKNKIMWPNTAGDLGDYFYTEVWAGTEGYIRIPKELKEIILDLGLSEQEYNQLGYNLRLQHERSGSSFVSADNLEDRYDTYRNKYIEAYGKENADKFDDFWNEQVKNFSGKGDFTHQSITTATILDNNIRLANLSGVVTGRFDSNAIDELAGWRGDTTKVPAENPSIGNDDYKADLDAVNITQRMNDQNLSYEQASNNYYNDLTSGQANRAKEFKDNSDFNYVKDEILSDLAPNYEYTFRDTTYQTQAPVTDPSYYDSVRTLTEQEKLDYVKENYPDSYNFIESLKNNENEYTNYAN
jgi:hypothetical protein